MASWARTFTSSSNRLRWICGLWLCLTLCVHVGFATNRNAKTLTFYINENAHSGTTVGTVPLNGGTLVNVGSIPTGVKVNSTGLIRTTRPLDREKEEKISFDTGVLASGITIYSIEIIVNDLNDNSPKFDKNVYFFKFYEEGSGSYEDVEAVDGDSGVNSTQKYSIVSGNIGHVFKLNSFVGNKGNIRGRLSLNGSLDREQLDRYLLNISAQDGGTPARIGYTLLNITVGDTNDNPPVFTSTNYFASILENATQGTSIATVSATDADIGTNAEIVYEINRGAHSDPQLIFSVDSKTGLVTNNLKLDYEKRKEYRIVVIARNSAAGGSGQTGSAWLTIKILDLNDNQPVIKVNYVLGGSYQALEGAPNGETVARIAVTDADSGSNGDVEVSLQNTEGYFRLEPIPGDGYAVKVAKLIDRESKSVFIAKIVATDKGVPAKTTEEFFRINVGDVNDNSPKFDNSVYHGSVSEDVVKGTPVLSVHATDSDVGTNEELVYNILSSVQDAAYKDWFTIVPATGEIKTAGVLDRENASQVVLTVTVTDKGSPPRTDNCTVTVEIRDANDNTPYFNQSLYFASVVENSPNGSHVVQVFADDRDIGINSVITYSIVSTGNEAVPFTVTNNSGMVSTTGPIDHEHRTSYTLTVAATDGGSRNTTTTVNITVIDQNDNSPLFSPEFYNLSYPEDAKVGSVLVNLSASDKDSDKFAKLRYDIRTGNSHGLFLVDHATGAIELAKSLDRETKDFHSLTVTVEDGGGRTSTNFATVNLKVLDVNDEAPVFEKQQYNFNITENSKVPSVLGSILATSKDIGSNADIYYTIKGGNIGGIFAINGSGVIYTQTSIDHEITSTVVLNVEAKDGGKPPLYGYTNVTVSVSDLNDNSPTFNSSQISVYIPENTKIGLPFYTLFAFDRDSREYGLVTYKLLENPNSTFQLDSITGKLSLLKTVSYEGITQYTARVLAQDGGFPPRNATVTLKLQVVDVNDHSPVFGNSSYHVYVNEATDANSDIIQVSAMDKDTGTNAVITYSLQSQPNSVSLHFGIKSDGAVFLRTKLDRERKAVYYLVVIAADHGVPVRTAHTDLTVYVTDDNDNTPKFNRSQGYTFSILENKDSGTLVGRLYATDLDTGSNAQLRYKFESPVSQFLLNSITGEIRTAEKLDREKKSNYDLMAVVSDSGKNPREDRVRVVVIIRDQNDNNPMFDRDANYRTSILENVRVGTSVLTVSASDPDDGLNGQLTYSIITGAENRFKIDSHTGIIRTMAALDREKKDLYVLSIEARDSGTPDKSSSKMVFVNILDVNDNHPQFPNNTKTEYLKEKVSAGSYVTTVTAKDPDKNLNGQVWYKIIQGNTGKKASLCFSQYFFLMTVADSCKQN